jgi:RNA polymerase sigma-70 factor (ECF subfamily)
MVASAHDRSLVLRAQSGDRAAFDELLTGIDAALLRYIRAIVGTRGSAEDLLQDVLITIVRKIGWLRDPELFRPWAFRIASRAAFRALRKDVAHEPLGEELSVTEADPADPWLLQRLASALPCLTEASRAVIYLHYVEEMSLSDVAAALGLNAGTVRSRLAYGLGQLRKELA